MDHKSLFFVNNGQLAQTDQAKIQSSSPTISHTSRKFGCGKGEGRFE
jgi:hypothetical protein